jgi:hypothetical protein
VSQDPVRRDHLRKITQTTTKRRVSINGRDISIRTRSTKSDQETARDRPQTPKDKAGISDKAKANGDDKTQGGDTTRGPETTTYGNSKTKNRAGRDESPGEVEDAATDMHEDGVTTRTRSTESLENNKTGLVDTPS